MRNPTTKWAHSNRIKLTALMVVVSLAAISCWNSAGPGKNDDLTLTGLENEKKLKEAAMKKSYGKFAHGVDEHTEISCDACHAREGTKLKYAGHASCVECHLGEFVSRESQICAVCHTTSPTKPEELLDFPVRFNEGFNMMFDHAQHSRGDAKPAEGCAACHRPDRSSQTIPAGISTHAQCFTCHTQESKIGSCSTCHEIAPYTRVRPRASQVLNYVFSHADHTSRQGVTCIECHTPKAGAPQGNQILFPVAVQHFTGPQTKGSVTCASCHNNRRAFGEENFADCKRCHTGSGFSLLPGG